MIAENEPRADGLEDVKLLNVSALAKCLAVSVRQAHRMNKNGLIPRPLKIGTCIRWDPDEISQWLRCGAPVRSVWEHGRVTQTVGDENA